MDQKDTKEVSFKELINPYLKNWKYFVGTVFLLLIIALYIIKSTPPIYKIQTSVLIKDAKKMSSASGDFGILQTLGGFSGMGTNSIENELGVFDSKTIVEDVLKQHNFQTPIYTKQTFNDLELYGKTSPYIINIIQEKKDVDLPKKPINIKIRGNDVVLSSVEWKKDVVTAFNKTISLPFALIMISKNPDFQAPYKAKMSDIYFNYNTFEDTVDDFQKSLNVELLDKDGTIINLSVDFENKEKAKDFLNGLVRQYNVYAINDKNIESKKTKDFIDKRILLISNELGDVETQKEGFKSNNNIVDLPTEAKINLQLKEQSKAQLLEIGTQIELTKILRSSLDRKGTEDVLPLNIGLDNEAAGKAIQEYNTLVLQRNKYLQDATPDNPIVKSANRQIQEMKTSLAESLQKNAVSLEFAKKKVESQLGGSEQMIGKIPKQEKLFRSIERQQQIKESLYLLLLQKREEAAISMEITAEKARVIDKAFVFKKPVAPKKIIILGVFFALGIFIPFLFIYFKKLLQSTIINRGDLTKVTTLPVIAEIPKLKNKHHTLVSFNDISPMAEAFRILVTNLRFLLPLGEGPHIILVTSSVKGEGKTFVSTNLSTVLASARDKVLVVGADIRNPQLQRYNTSMKTAKGLTEFLSGEDITLSEVIHPSSYNDNCDFIYSGSIPPNPTDLLQNGKLDELLTLIKGLGKYKYIVLDTAPLLLVTDSFLISDKSDVVVFVTRSEVTERGYIEFLNNSVQDKKLKNVGIVLNDVSESNFGYGNKYGYGYQAEEKKWWQKFYR
ncbi:MULTISPECIES: GumC family protein [Chryseobacterium]|uniref:non-specific protein-tyrosine kinase n=1 Tax=Chryseobacterium camelliae TaxID=1265445 RepID=A0ABU0TFU5_9FLAO|nr:MULTISPECIES: tyrosine-protein kinase [Chryseobacterium]MDT3407074.1 tyrosine-protein kinase Etk/Wzc [Pseudacidovorax intermedius]MDQ1095135.1 tyrosine-protein kinase Etk/Wzc [Chryseobacterium camelliae]MDQ1099072.1 tyrosine-protein kinase Etk/Wzc [Chryseobacterium sp. SORGH_AS_1048]MDR6086422.1 tyrosine-protein kinase Etk/Wzc [Chryseobacterium sp. SORGH_AS_0909]MDR6130794.1 tyrosine-protein kinase Etk/Wzc [Chryseobacterium sp. SORGH_AS_1175]